MGIFFYIYKSGVCLVVNKHLSLNSAKMKIRGWRGANSTWRIWNCSGSGQLIHHLLGCFSELTYPDGLAQWEAVLSNDTSCLSTGWLNDCKVLQRTTRELYQKMRQIHMDWCGKISSMYFWEVKAGWRSEYRWWFQTYACIGIKFCSGWTHKELLTA